MNKKPPLRITRREFVGGALTAAGVLTRAPVLLGGEDSSGRRQRITPSTARDAVPRPLRGIYGGVPQEILDAGTPLRDFGLDAVWLGAGSFTPERLALLRAEGMKVYAEFNTLHVADYLKEHPDAAPIGADGRVSPPPQGWQGICPTHEGYRRFRMEAQAFRPASLGRPEALRYVVVKCALFRAQRLDHVHA